ncbi:hypothetical protein OG474_25435 [Kribbella sp. NBC_01505]|uniref:hypothetical protein n=1 Tax=Kribbella sp. NBC_01505 TaxID=2903580 RepID=UPI003863B568
MSASDNGYGCSWSSRSRLWLLLVLACLVSACMASPPPPAAVVVPTPTVQAPSQPYDVFRGDLLDAIAAAVRVDRDHCLAEAGYPELQQAAGRQRSGTFDDLRVSTSSFGATSAAEARRRGFGRELPAEPPAIRSTSQKFSDAVDRCTQEANARRGPDAMDVQSRYYDLGNQLRMALRPVYADAMPARFAVPVLACLQGKGFTSTDKTADIRTFGVAFGRPDARPYVPTAQESDLAAAWHDCTTAAGWTRYQLDRALALEASTVRRLKPQLDELTPAIESLAHKAVTPSAG